MRLNVLRVGRTASKTVQIERRRKASQKQVRRASQQRTPFPEGPAPERLRLTKPIALMAAPEKKPIFLTERPPAKWGASPQFIGTPLSSSPPRKSAREGRKVIYTWWMCDWRKLCGVWLELGKFRNKTGFCRLMGCVADVTKGRMEFYILARRVASSNHDCVSN